MKTIELLFFLIMISALVLLSWAIYIMRTDGLACLQDPLVYGVKQIEEHGSDPLMCSCSFTTGPSQTLQVTSKGKQIINPTNTNSVFSKFNFSKIEFGNISS